MKRIFFSLLILAVILTIGYKIVNKSQPTIPKIIHYVWLGSKELPESVKQSIQTWKKHNPDYIIKRWDESNCNINDNPFANFHYQNKRYDFASDWCRILALEEGGIYLDTDMILNKPLTPLLDEPLVLTLQLEDDLSASFMAITPHHPYIKELKKKYDDLPYLDITSPILWNETFLEYFKENKIPVKREKNKYHVYSPNILMHDFKGGENVAEHLYANSDKNLKKSRWYDIIRKKFLHKYAYYFPDKDFYLIKKNFINAYFIDAKTLRLIEHIKYFQYKNFLYMFYPNSTLFYCKRNICQPYSN